jgi:WD40 repeat protein
VKKVSAKDERSSPSRSRRNNLPYLTDDSNHEMENIKRVPADDSGKLKDFIRQRRTKRITRSSHGTAGAEPVFSSEPLIAYKYDPSLAQHEEVIFTVKTMLQLEKNDYQAELMKRPNLGVFGREAARPYVLGIVAAFSLAYDRFDWSLAEAKWAFSAVEPYGVDASRNKMALATASSVQLIDMDTGEGRLCNNPWLNQGHTVEFSPDGKKLLVGSSGFDAVFEFDTTSGEIVWEWFAWDHGFDRSKLGHYVVRSTARCKALAAMGHEVLLVDDPEKYKFGIPTRQKPAHLNSAYYDSDGRILVTLFHQGAGYVVDRNTGEAQEVVSGLSNPHKLSRRKRGGYFISDTKGGKLIFFDEKYRPDYEISLAGTPGVARSPDLWEFLQNTTELREDLFACIDIHRSSLWLIDVRRRRYRGIKFPVEWSVHDVASVGHNLGRRIGNLVSTQFGKVAAFARQLKIIHHFAVDGREITALALDTQGRHRAIDG